MAKKKQPEQKGAPEWVLTYGDMMSLLLCFFVILFSLSEIKDDQKVRQILENLRESFGGLNTSTGQVIGEKPPMNTLLKVLQEWRRPREKQHAGDSPMKGQHGKYTEVRRINEGLEFRVGRGGRTPFVRGSAEIDPEFKAELAPLADVLRDFTNVLSVRGHCSLDDFPPGTARGQYDRLSYERAQAIKDFLIDRCGLEARRLRAVACGDMQPLVAMAYDEDQHAENRRVEIICRQVLVDDYALAAAAGESGE